MNNKTDLQSQEELQKLRKLREHYEEQLRHFGIELCDLPEDLNRLLDECVQLQRATNVHDLSPQYLQEFYFTKKKENIDQMLKMQELQDEVKLQQDQIKTEMTEIGVLEKLTASGKRTLSESESKHILTSLQDKIKDLQERKAKLKLPDGFDIDELLRKVDLLQMSKAKDKK